MKPSITVTMGQSLHLTPQLLQSIRLLQLPAAELEQEVKDALERNVMLEAEDEASDQGASPADTLREETALEAPTAAAPGGDDEEGWQARTAAPEITDARLKVYEQLKLTLSAHELAIAEALLDQVNDAGYLDVPFGEAQAAVQHAVQCTPSQILAVLHQLQRCDPPGYGAADLRDCLLIQLELTGPRPGRNLAMRIVDQHLAALAEPDVAQLAVTLDTTADKVERALALIRTLAPKPGATGDDGTTEYVRPDVVMRRVGGRWVVDLNGATTPRLRINGVYEQLLNHCKDENQARALRDQLAEARWMVRGLQMRNDTLLRTARVIAQRQGAFLERGEEGMKPLTLREVADAIGMHESTVSRITTRKYAQTPRGLFELKHFFASPMADGDRGGASGTAVRAMVKRMIEGETPGAPLADGVIARLLERQGVRIARRTVSKYREALHIASARERVRLPG